MSVLGFQEASATAETVGLSGGRQVLTVSLPMLAALKLLAWRDRGEGGDDKDAEDLMVILAKYLDAGNIERFPQDAEVMLGNEFDYATAGALLAGRDLRTLLSTLGTSAAAAQESVTRILRREVELGGDGALAYAMAGTSGDYAVSIIRAFSRGMNS